MTQPQGAVAVSHGLPSRRSMVGNSFGLLVGKGLQAMAGFLFWVVAARATSVREVGITAAAVSAVMMCTQLALLGAGSAVIVAVGSGRDARAVLDTAFSVVTGASILLGLGYLLIASRLDGNGTAAAGTPAFWLVFVTAVVAGTLMIVLDQANVAFGRGGSSTPRYGLAGVATIAAVVWVGWQAGEPDAVVMFACWSMGAVVACVVGAVQLRRLIDYRYRPSLRLRQSRRLLGVGIPNQVLTLTERAPGLLIPVLIAHVVSPESAAYWYPAWMMAWAAYSAPVLMGVVHFSEGVRDPSGLGRTTRTSLTWSIGTGLAIAAVLALGATPLLHLMGAEYAEQSSGALRWLAAGLVAYAVLQAYNAVCRSRGRFAEAIAVGAGLGGLLCSATLSVSGRGVTAMALAWVSVLAAGSVFASLRLMMMLRGAAND